MRRLPKYTLLALGWLLAGVFACWVVFLALSVETSKTSLTQQSPTAEKVLGAHSPSVVEEAVDDSSQGEQLERTSTRDELLAILSEDERAERRYRFYQLLENLQPGEFEDFYSELQSLPYSKRKGGMLGSFFERWAEFDSMAAVTAAMAEKGAIRNHLMSDAAAGWAKNDPRGAWEWIMNMNNRGAVWDIHSFDVIAEIAKTNPGLSLELVPDITNEWQRGFHYRMIAGEIALNRGFGDAVEYISTMGDGVNRKNFTSELWKEWGKYDSTAAVDALKVLTDEKLKETALLSLMNGWATQDPSSATNYALGELSGEIQDQALQAVLTQWTNNGGINDVAALLNDLPANAESDKIASSIIRNMAQVDIESAIKWGDSIENEALREKSRLSTMWFWGSQDFEAANNYVGAMEAGREKDLSLQRLVWSQSSSSNISDSVFPLIDNISDDSLREQALRGIIDHATYDFRGSNTIDKERLAQGIRNLQNVSEEEKERALQIIE